MSSECELKRSQQASYRRSRAIPSSSTCQEARYVAWYRMPGYIMYKGYFASHINSLLVSVQLHNLDGFA